MNLKCILLITLVTKIHGRYLFKSANGNFFESEFENHILKREIEASIPEDITEKEAKTETTNVVIQKPKAIDEVDKTNQIATEDFNETLVSQQESIIRPIVERFSNDGYSARYSYILGGFSPAAIIELRSRISTQPPEQESPNSNESEAIQPLPQEPADQSIISETTESQQQGQARNKRAKSNCTLEKCEENEDSVYSDEYITRRLSFSYTRIVESREQLSQKQ